MSYIAPLTRPTNVACVVHHNWKAASFKCLRSSDMLKARSRCPPPQHHRVRAYHSAPVSPISASELMSQIQTQNHKSDIESLISSLPLVRYLRDWKQQMSKPDEPVYGETRLHNGLHASVAGKHLTSDSIMGKDKMPVKPHFFIQQGPPFKAITVCHIGTHLCGHPGYVHGGVPFSLFDDIFARCAGLAFPSGVGMTANLSLNFRKPMIPGRIYIIRVEMEKLEGRKLSMKGTMRCLPSFSEADMTRREAALNDDVSIEEKEADVVVEASSLFIEPKFAESMVRLFKY